MLYGFDMMNLDSLEMRPNITSIYSRWWRWNSTLYPVNIYPTRAVACGTYNNWKGIPSSNSIHSTYPASLSTYWVNERIIEDIMSPGPQPSEPGEKTRVPGFDYRRGVICFCDVGSIGGGDRSSPPPALSRATLNPGRPAPEGRVSCYRRIYQSRLNTFRRRKKWSIKSDPRCWRQRKTSFAAAYFCIDKSSKHSTNFSVVLNKPYIRE